MLNGYWMVVSHRQVAALIWAMSSTMRSPRRDGFNGPTLLQNPKGILRDRSPFLVES